MGDFDLYKVALFCFPKFKSLSILPIASMRNDVLKRVKSMLSDPKFGDSEVVATISTDDHHYEKAKCSKTDYAMDFGDFADEPNDEETSDEITKYLYADFSGEDFGAEGHINNFDVLKFWKEKMSSNQVFDYTHCNTPKHVTSWPGPSLRHCAQATQLLSKKYRGGGEPLATLCPI